MYTKGPCSKFILVPETPRKFLFFAFSNKLIRCLRAGVEILLFLLYLATNQFYEKG